MALTMGSHVSHQIFFFEEMLNKCQTVDTVSVDFSKAFDKVLCGSLIQKFRSLEYRARYKIGFVVGVRGCYSDWGPGTSEVPQRGLLGPLLSSIVMNEMTKHVAELGSFQTTTSVV